MTTINYKIGQNGQHGHNGHNGPTQMDPTSEDDKDDSIPLIATGKWPMGKQNQQQMNPNDTVRGEDDKGMALCNQHQRCKFCQNEWSMLENDGFSTPRHYPDTPTPTHRGSGRWSRMPPPQDGRADLNEHGDRTYDEIDP